MIAALALLARVRRLEDALRVEVLESLECPCCAEHAICDPDCTLEVDAPEVYQTLKEQRQTNARIRAALADEAGK